MRCGVTTFTREEFISQLPLSKQTSRRRAKKIDHLGQMRSTPVPLIYRVLPGEQGTAFV